MVPKRSSDMKLCDDPEVSDELVVDIRWLLRQLMVNIDSLGSSRESAITWDVSLAKVPSRCVRGN